MKKRLLILMLAIVMLLCVSCNRDGNNEDVTTNDTEEDTEAVQYLDHLPETDAYRGTEFRILAGESSKNDNFLKEAPVNGTAIQEASYDCALLLEERFGITLTYKFMDSYSSGHKAFLEEITMTTLGGSTTAYDLVVPGYWYGMTIAKDCYTDLNTLTYLDFSQPWWNKAFNENVAINGILYACVGDFSLDSANSSYAVVFNQKLLTDLGMTSPFEHYDNNTWTLETLLGMTKQAYNGDIVGSERYGMVLSRQPVDAFYTASDLKIIEVNDGDYKLTKYSEKAEDLYQKLYNIIYKDDCINFTTVTEKAANLELFMQDRALFGCFVLGEIPTLRAMVSDYGVIVYPKYDAAQKEYISGTAGGGIFAIPKTARDPEMSSLVLEAMCAAFHKDVIPALIDVTLEGQSVRDERSAEMITKIIENVYWDFGFINHTSIGNVANFAIQMEGGYSTMSSWYRTFERTYNSKLTEYLNTFLTGE